MISASRAAGLCLPKPEPFRSPSSSRRVRARHHMNQVFHTETIAALNILSQNVAVSSEPFPSYSPSAAVCRDSDFISDRVNRFLTACRASGCVDMRPSTIAEYVPGFSSCEFLGPSTSTSRQRDSALPASSTPRVVPQAPRPDSFQNEILSSLRELDPYGTHADLAPAAVAVDADLVSLPSAAGVCDILRFLPPKLAAQYASPLNLLRTDPISRPSSRSAFLVKDGHYAKLLQRMNACGMLAWSDQKPEVVNGIFAVPKADGSQRLIIDARRANACFVDPDRVSLPTPDFLGNLEVPSGSDLFVAKADLSDFYHALRLPEPWWTFFGLPSVSPADVGLASRFPRASQIWPMIRTLPMGFSHAVLLAQNYHLGLIDQRVPLLRRSDMIGPGSDIRADRLRWSIYIDDLSLLAMSAAVAERALEQYDRACRGLGFIIKPSKLQHATNRGTEVTGLLIDGTARSIGVAPHKLALLAHHTLALIRSHYVNATALSSLLGKWNWAILVRRPALSVFGAVYRWLRVFRDRTAPLWPSARLELAVMCALSPLLVGEMSDTWFRDTAAVDASSLGLGVVASALSKPLVAGLAAAAGFTPDDAFRADDIFDTAMRATSRKVVDLPGIQEQVASASWRTIVSHRWKRPEHINVLEATALRTAVRWVHSHRSASRCRILIIADSAVVVSATSKGRSSSLALLFNCRRTAAFLLSSGLHLFIRWVPSEINPADAASRAF